jgi:tRNA U34 5-carboxymethylaminomethyl modifying GTPase MnmE/TrmE
MNNDNDNKIKNILLVGATGNGISTLGNVLVNENGNFEEVFETSSRSSSTTKEVQVEEFEENGARYRIIDTPGIRVTGLTPHQWAKKMVESFQNCPEGINQILFVFRGSFHEENIELYNQLKLIGENINQYITMVITKFSDFRSEKKCQENYEDLKNEKLVNTKIASIFKEIVVLISVDNSPREEDPNQKRKKISREKLINHLNNCRGSFQPVKLREDYFLPKEKKIEKIEKLNEEVANAEREANLWKKEFKLMFEQRLTEKSETVENQQQLIERTERLEQPQETIKPTPHKENKNRGKSIFIFLIIVLIIGLVIFFTKKKNKKIST